MSRNMSIPTPRATAEIRGLGFFAERTGAACEETNSREQEQSRAALGSGLYESERREIMLSK